MCILGRPSGQALVHRCRTAAGCQRGRKWGAPGALSSSFPQWGPHLLPGGCEMQGVVGVGRGRGKCPLDADCGQDWSGCPSHSWAGATVQEASIPCAAGTVSVGQHPPLPSWELPRGATLPLTPAWCEQNTAECRSAGITAEGRPRKRLCCETCPTWPRQAQGRWQLGLSARAVWLKGESSTWGSGGG